MIAKLPEEIKTSVYFIVLTLLLSWPVILLIDGWVAPNLMGSGKDNLAIFLVLFSHAFAMFCPTIASFILSGKINLKSILRWKWSKPKYYYISFSILILIWTVPALIGIIFYDSLELRSSVNLFQWVYMLSYIVIVYFSSIGEEFGWCAFLLTLLAEKFSRTRATIISGVYRGVWHLPFLISPILYRVISGDKSILLLLMMSIIFLLQLIISNILFGSVFSFIWYKTKSLPLLGWVHYTFDLLRDFIAFFIIGYNTNVFYRFGWAIPFYVIAYLFLSEIAKEEGITNLLKIKLMKAEKT